MIFITPPFIVFLCYCCMLLSLALHLVSALFSTPVPTYIVVLLVLIHVHTCIQCTIYMFMYRLYLFCRNCIEHALSENQTNCPICHIPTWIKDVKSDRQVATLIKCVTALNDLTTTVHACNDQEGNVHICTCKYTRCYEWFIISGQLYRSACTYTCKLFLVVRGECRWVTLQPHQNELTSS